MAKTKTKLINGVECKNLGFQCPIDLDNALNEYCEKNEKKKGRVILSAIAERIGYKKKHN